MRNPLAVLGPRRRGAGAVPSVAVPAPRPRPDAGPAAGEGGRHLPEVVLREVVTASGVPSARAAVELGARPGAPGPCTVDELLARGRTGDFRVRRVAFDLRALELALARRGGCALLDQLSADPADRVTNAVFRAAVAGDDDGRGDLDCDVLLDAGAERVGLGRARLVLTPLLTGSERLARRLAEVHAQPRDRAVRRCLEYALGVTLATTPLAGLFARPAAPA